MKNTSLSMLVTGMLLTLSACGGSSSSDSATNSNNTGIAENKQTILLQTYTQQCYSETPYQADIVFHGSNGESLGSAKVAADGHFSGEMPVGTEHLSILGDVIDDDREHFKQIYTELDIQHRSNLGKFYFQRYSDNCQCQRFEVDTSELIASSFYNAVYDGFGQRVIDEIEVCPGRENLYFTLGMDSWRGERGAVIPVPSDSTVIKLKEADFVHENYRLREYAGQGASRISVRGYFGAEDDYQFVQSQSPTSYMPMYIYPSATDKHFLMQYYYGNGVADNVDVNYMTYARNQIAADGSYTLTRLPEISNGFATEMLMLADSDEMSYDFSGTDERFARAVWRYSFLVDDAQETRFDWSIHSPVRATVPDLEFGDVLAEPQGEITLEELGLVLYGYEGTAVDNAAFSALLEEQVSSDHLNNEKFANYVYFYMVAKPF